MTRTNPKLLPFIALAFAALTGLAVQNSAVREASAAMTDNGIVTTRSAYPFDETITRIKADIAQKGIKFFLEVDQQKLAADAGIKLTGRSTLLIFGNPALGSHFITSNRQAGIDWPVRLLVTEAESGGVFVVNNDFDWIARRHSITNRPDQFAMATKVITSIVGSVAK